MKNNEWRVKVKKRPPGGVLLKTVFFRILTRKKAPSKKTQAYAKSMNTNTVLVGTSNQLFIIGSQTKTKFSKKSSY